MPEQTQTDQTFETTFEFPWKSPPLHANQRIHWAKRKDITKALRTEMHARARHIPDLGKCEVELVWVVADRRRRDADNIVPTLKALCDGLVDAEIVADDVPELMVKRMPSIRYVKGCTPHFEFTVKAVS